MFFLSRSWPLVPVIDQSIKLTFVTSPPLHPQYRWPAIIGIILASLLVLSILLCIVRCLFCGAECCGCCLSCCGCCGSRRRPPRWDNQAPPPPFQPSPYNNGYQPTPNPPIYNQPPPMPYAQQPFHQAPQPQYAQFDASSRKPAGIINEDALPAMPSWDNASQTRVLDDSPLHHDDDVELGHLDPVAQQTAPMLAHQAQSPRAGYSEMETGTVPIAAGLAYQQQGLHQGGDLGNPYGQNGVSPTNQYHPGFGPQSPTTQQGGGFYPQAASPPPSYRDGSFSPIQQPAAGAGVVGAGAAFGHGASRISPQQTMPPFQQPTSVMPPYQQPLRSPLAMPSAQPQGFAAFRPGGAGGVLEMPVTTQQQIPQQHGGFVPYQPPSRKPIQDTWRDV